MNDPQVTETKISYGGGGKVAIANYSAITSDYHVAVTRTYAIPDDWNETSVEEFELAKIEEIRDAIGALLDGEFNERFEQSYMNRKR